MKNYYDLYANQADSIDLLKLGIEKIAAQVAELNPDENAQEAAEQIFQEALSLAAARQLGSIKTAKKSAASAANGRKGGRPKSKIG